MTKDEILRNAIGIISEEGYECMTLSRLSEKLGVKKASIYYHFKSKDEIIDSLYSSLKEKLKTSGFSVSFSLSAEEIYSLLFTHWRQMLSGKETEAYLSLLEQRKAIDDRADEIWASLRLMMEAQALAVTENLQERGKIHVKSPRLISELFSSSSFLRLLSEHNEEEDEEFLAQFTSEIA